MLEIGQFLENFDNLLWTCFAVPAILILGLYFSIKTQFIQIRLFPYILRIFIQLLRNREKTELGIHPLKAFFAAVGGCIGIGNVVAVCAAIQIGGPGALFWIWVTAILGSIVKYAEVFLGMKFRILDEHGVYHGGPMYFLKAAFKNQWIPPLVCLLLCIYGVEIYQFNVVTNTVADHLNVDKTLTTAFLLVLVIGTTLGGVKRVGQVSSFMIPFFVLLYLGMGSWVIFQNISALPNAINEILSSAFSGHAAIGGFLGSGILLTVSQGIRRGCYSGDVGIGYASVIHSETSATRPERQAALVIFDIFLDSFMICSTSVILVVLTDVWKSPMDASLLVQTALGHYFPFMEIFMPIFIFLLGYSTIIAYFCTGLKCATFLSPRLGKTFFYLYGTLAFVAFSFIDTTHALIIMSITGALLLVINLSGIFVMRHSISFAIKEPEEKSLILDLQVEKN